MFSRLSRYRKLPEVVTVDPRGRQLASKALRPMPEVAGVLQHSIEASDRLDHLAYKFYKQSRHWWRICDANPDHASPLELLGQTPLTQCRIPLPGDEALMPYPWTRVLHTLHGLPGVEGVVPEERVSLVEEARSVAGATVVVNAERFHRAVTVTFNRRRVEVERLVAALADAGFASAEPETIGRVGKALSIPRNVTL